MAVAIGASGIVGIARESVSGTYLAPEFYLPVRNESINFVNEVQYTRPIMQVADQVHAVEGPQRVEGDLEMELFPDALVYLMAGTRMDLTKAGAGPYTYTYKPNANATPASTLSFTVVRNGVVFGYVGCVIGSMEFTVDNGLFVGSFNVLGIGEAPQSAPTPTWPTQEPAGADAYDIRIAAASFTNTDNFSMSIDDSAEAVYRLGNAQQAAFVKFGERTVEATLDMDFEDATEYTNFKNVTAQRLEFDVDWDANNYIHFDTPLATMATFETGLDGQGDLVRASISYMAKYDFSTTQSFDIEISSDTNIT